MCGISGFEFTVIMIAAIIVLGPEKLPEVLRMFGKLTQQIRRWKGDLGDIARDVQSSIPVEQIRKEMTEGLDLDRARTRLKETESEIDALRARLKAKVAEEEADIDRAVRGDRANRASAEPTLDAPISSDAVNGPVERPLARAVAGASLVGAGVDDDFGTAPSAPLPSIKQAAHIAERSAAADRPLVATPIDADVAPLAHHDTATDEPATSQPANEPAATVTVDADEHASTKGDA